MEEIKLDKQYNLPFVDGEEWQGLKEELVEKFACADLLSDSKYHHFIYNYLIYINGRDVIGELNIMYDSELVGTSTNMSTVPFVEDKPSLISFNPNKKHFFEFQVFKKLFDAIDSMEHEMAHNFDQKYLISPYKKMVCESGKSVSFYRSHKIRIKEIFENSSLKYIAMIWGDLGYYSHHSEQFARKKAYENTKRFFREMIDFAELNNFLEAEINEIVDGFNEYEKEVLKEEQVFMDKAKLTFSNRGRIAEKDFADLKDGWNNFIEKLCIDSLQSLEYLNQSKIEGIQANLVDIVELCNYKTIYKQENFDKLFAWQLGKEKLDLGLLMRIICQKRNTASKKQLGFLMQKVKGSPEEQKFYKACQKLFAKQEEKPLVNPNILEK